jgi:hypothetical protein
MVLRMIPDRIVILEDHVHARRLKRKDKAGARLAL